MLICAPHTSGACEGQKRALDALVLELKTVRGIQIWGHRSNSQKLLTAEPDSIANKDLVKILIIKQPG